MSKLRTTILYAGAMVSVVATGAAAATGKVAYNISVQSVFFIQANSAGTMRDGLLPSQVHVGETVGLECSINAGPVPVPRFDVGLFVDNRRMGPESSDKLTVAIGKTNAMYVLKVPAWKATAGKHNVRCTANSGWGHVVENNYNDDSRSMQFTLGPARPGVAVPPLAGVNAVRRSGAAGRLKQTPLLAKNTKICKPTLMADVEIRPVEFAASAWKPAANGVQVPHVPLRLKRSSAAGNEVICTYATVHGDVMLTTNLDCNNARQGGSANTYRCEP